MQREHENHHRQKPGPAEHSPPAAVVTRPLLARHARYRWDTLRQQHQLVFPEGVLVLNDTGAAIVRHCDGRPLNDLLGALRDEFTECVPPADVYAFLERLSEKGLVRDATVLPAGGADLPLPAEVSVLQQPAAAASPPSGAGHGNLEPRAV